MNQTIAEHSQPSKVAMMKNITATPLPATQASTKAMNDHAYEKYNEIELRLNVFH